MNCLNNDNVNYTTRSLKSFSDWVPDDSRTVKGSARIAVNEWLSQFNMRMAQIKAPAGMETKITVTPTYQTASVKIKGLKPKDRHCQFLHEVQVLKK